MEKTTISIENMVEKLARTLELNRLYEKTVDDLIKIITVSFPLLNEDVQIKRVRNKTLGHVTYILSNQGLFKRVSRRVDGKRIETEETIELESLKEEPLFGRSELELGEVIKSLIQHTKSRHEYINIKINDLKKALES